MSTWNRCAQLSGLIDSFEATRSRDYSWTLLIADDGSTDATLDYLSGLELPDCRVVVIRNKAATITGQTNSLFLASMSLGFEFGFKADDDVFFIKPGWDREYYETALETGFEHLVYHNVDWKAARHEKLSGQARSLVPAREALGCFYTFSPKVLEEVGFFDEVNFVFRGHAHIDFTFRCCRAGFNDEETLWDVRGSSDSVGMVSREEYVHLVDWSSPEVKKLLGPEERARRMRLIDTEDRVFIPITPLDPASRRSRVSVAPLEPVAEASLAATPRFESVMGPSAPFDAVYVLNLDQDPLRWAVTAEALARHGLQFERFPAVNGNLEEHARQWRSYAARGLTSAYERGLGRKLIQSPGAWGYLLTMERLILEAKKRRLRNVLVFDDDIVLHRSFQPLLASAWSELPSWKLLYLGCSQFDWSVAVERSPHLYHPRGAANGSFAVAISSEVFDLALEEIRKFEAPFDAGALRAIDSAFPNETFAIKPHLVVADVTSSTIRPPRDLQRFAVDAGWSLEEYESRSFARQPVDRSERRSLSQESQVSILMVCQNVEDVLADSLESLRFQTHGKLEILLLDNASDDRTLQVMRKLRERDSRIRLFRLKERQAFSRSVSALMKHARGEYFSFQEPGEVSLPDRLARSLDRQRASSAPWQDASIVPVRTRPPAGLRDQASILSWSNVNRARGDVSLPDAGLVDRVVYEIAGDILLDGREGITEWIARAKIVLGDLDSESTDEPSVPVSIRTYEDAPSTIAPSSELHDEIRAGLRPAFVSHGASLGLDLITEC